MPLIAGVTGGGSGGTAVDPGAPTGIGDAIGAGAGAGENLLLLPPGSAVRFCTGGTVAGAETGAGIAAVAAGDPLRPSRR